MISVVLFLFLLSFPLLSKPWQNLSIDVNGTLLEKVNTISKSSDRLVFHDVDNDRLVYYTNSEWSELKDSDISENIKSVLSVTSKNEYEYVFVQNNDDSYQLIIFEFDITNNQIINYEFNPPIESSEDDLSKMNRLIFSADDDILINYSDQEGESNKILLHKLAYYSDFFLDTLEYNYRNFTFKQENQEDKITSNGIYRLDDEYNHVFKTTSDINVIYFNLENENAKNNLGFNSRKFDFPSSHHIEIENVPGRKNSYFRFQKNLKFENNNFSFFIAVDSIKSNQQEEIINEQYICFYDFNGDIFDDNLMEKQIKLPYNSTFISNFHVNNDNVIIFIKNIDNNGIYTLFSDDLGGYWAMFYTNELEGIENIKIQSMGNEYFIYNEEEIYFTDIIASVETSNPTCQKTQELDYYDLLGNKLDENNIFNKQIIVRYKCIETGEITHKLEIRER